MKEPVESRIRNPVFYGPFPGWDFKRRASKANAIRTNIYVGLSYGLEANDFKESHLAASRAAVMDVINGRSDHHETGWFYAAGSAGSDLDPVNQLFIRRCQGLGDLMRWKDSRKHSKTISRTWRTTKVGVRANPKRQLTILSRHRIQQQADLPIGTNVKANGPV